VEKAIKHDKGKLRYDLVPPDALNELAHVYTYGASKYTDRNWEKGMDYGRVFAAIQRHLWAFWSGEELDKESNLHHLAHAAWGCLTLLSYSIRRVGEDDRVKTITSRPKEVIPRLLRKENNENSENQLQDKHS